MKNSGYLTLEEPQDKTCQKQKKHDKTGFRCPEEPGDWELIVTYFSSLYYAMKTNRLIYCKTQLYKNSEELGLNKSKEHSEEVLELDSSDRKIF